MSTKDIVNAIADSIVAEVDGADAWTILRHEPIWKNPQNGVQLAIYGNVEANTLLTANAAGGGIRTNGYHEDSYEIVVEYIEPAARKQKRGTRDEEAELDLYDRAEEIRAWADAHQAFPDVDAHRFDWIRTSHAPTFRQELLVRFFQLTFQARKLHQYA